MDSDEDTGSEAPQNDFALIGDVPAAPKQEEDAADKYDDIHRHNFGNKVISHHGSIYDAQGLWLQCLFFMTTNRLWPFSTSSCRAFCAAQRTA